MTPQEKVTSFKTSKRLKELGFPQDTERFWKHGAGVSLRNHNYPQTIDTSDFCYEYAAPDAQEIGELLPFRNKYMGTINDAIFTEHKLRTTEKGQWYIVGYVDEDNIRHPFDFHTYRGKLVRFDHENEAEARAACWIWLKEQGLI